MAQLKDLLVSGASRFVGKLYANGGIVLNNSTEQETPEYILGIKGFADGGNVIWQSKNNISVGYATSAGTATYDLSGKQINSTYVKLAGDTMTGKLNVPSLQIVNGAIFGATTGTVLGTSKIVTTVSQQLVLQAGAVFAGTALSAGLVTRGICGVSTPNTSGSCDKAQLFINYDGDNTYNISRGLILNAGSTGSHLGSGLYQYAVPRGDIVAAYVESKIPTIKKYTTTVTTAGTSVAFGTTLTSATDLQVYQNGLLLTIDTNYTVNSGLTGITLVGYSAEVGDIFTFITSSGAATSAVPEASEIPYTNSNNSSITNVKLALDSIIGKYVPLAGGTMTGKLTCPYIETGTAASNYFQSQKFRGEGNADTYYHAIDFGYTGHNQVDFHEYGATWNFYKNTSGTSTGGTLVASIQEDGFHGDLTVPSLTDLGSNSYDIAVFNSSGRLYKRAKSNFLTDFTGLTTTTTSGAKSLRNIMYKTEAPTADEGENGDICIVYTP